MTGNPGTSRREIFGWCMYDFANSAYATTIMAVIFNVYFTTQVAAVVTHGREGRPDVQGVMISDWFVPAAAFFTFTVSASMMIVAAGAPILGAVADYSGAKKKFLLAFCLLGVLFTALLGLVGPGDYWMGAAFLILSNIGFSGSLPFYNAFLPEIATDKNIGRISGYGWGLGYIGGGLLLVLNLLLLRNAHTLGLSNLTATRLCFLSVAAWWAVFSLPLLLWVRQRGQPQAFRPGENYVNIGFRRVWRTLRQIRRYRELCKLLIAFLIYNDAIETVIIMAAVFGAEVLDMPQDRLVVYFLMVQAAACVGSLICGWLCDLFGNRQVIIGTLVIWNVVVFWAYALGIIWHPETEYWILGVLAGLVLGGSQSASRALQGQFMPPPHAAEFFGFFALSGKFAAVAGPLMYGSLTMLTGSVQAGILSLGMLFVVGLILMCFISESKGITERNAE